MSYKTQRVLSRLFLAVLSVIFFGCPNSVFALGFSGKMNFLYGRSNQAYFLESGKQRKTVKDNFLQAYSLSTRSALISRKLMPFSVTTGYQKSITSTKGQGGKSHGAFEGIDYWVRSKLLPQSPMPIRFEFYRTQSNMGSENTSNVGTYNNRSTDTYSLDTDLKGRIIPTITLFARRSVVANGTSSVQSDQFGFSLKKGVGLPFTLGNTDYRFHYGGTGSGAYSSNGGGLSGAEGMSNILSLTAATKFSPRTKLTQSTTFSRLDGGGKREQSGVYTGSLSMVPTPLTTHLYSYSYSLGGTGSKKTQRHSMSGAVNYKPFSTVHLRNRLRLAVYKKAASSTMSFGGGSSLSLTHFRGLSSNYGVTYSRSKSTDGSVTLGNSISEQYGANAGVSANKKFRFLNMGSSYSTSYAKQVYLESFNMSQSASVNAASANWKFVTLSSSYSYSTGIVESTVFLNESPLQPPVSSNEGQSGQAIDAFLPDPEPSQGRLIIADTNKTTSFNISARNRNTKYVALSLKYKQRKRNSYTGSAEHQAKSKGITASLTLSLIKKAPLTGSVSKNMSESYSITESNPIKNYTTHDNIVYSASARHSVDIFGRPLTYQFQYRKSVSNKVSTDQAFEGVRAASASRPEISTNNESISKIYKVQYSRNIVRYIKMQLRATRRYSIRENGADLSMNTRFVSNFRYNLRVWGLNLSYSYNQSERQHKKAYNEHRINFSIGRGFGFGLF